MKLFQWVMMSAVAVLLVAAPAWAAPSVGRVTDVLGQATVKRADGKSLNIRTFTPLFEGDEIQTGASGRVKMLFTDDSVITVSPDTVFQVAQMAFSQQKAERTGLFSLLRGRIRAAVAKYSSAIKSRYEIKTPTAVAGIRGTVVTLGTGLQGLNDYLALESGSVQWCQGSNCIDVPQGVVAFIGANGQWVQQALNSGAFEDYVNPGQMENEDPEMGEGSGGGFEGDPLPLTPEQVEGLQKVNQLFHPPNPDERGTSVGGAMENTAGFLNIHLRFPY